MIDKLNQNNVAEFDRYFSPKSYVVDQLPNEKSVRDSTEVYMKNNTGAYDVYKMINGSWIVTNSNLNTKEVVTISGSGGSGTAGVDSFNGRKGAVTPASGDYTNSDVGLGNVTDDAQLKASQLDTDGTLAADSNSNVASQKATKTYVDTEISNNNSAVIKLTDETKNSDTTLADDSELVFSLAANSKYLLEIFIGFYFDAAPDIKIQLAFSGTITSWLANSIVCENDTAATFTNLFNDAVLTTIHSIISASNTNGILKIKSIFEVGASGGNFSVQWAQNTSDAGNTKVKKGSYIKVRKL